MHQWPYYFVHVINSYAIAQPPSRPRTPTSVPLALRHGKMRVATWGALPPVMMDAPSPDENSAGLLYTRKV